LTNGPFHLVQAQRAGLTRWHLASHAWRALGGGVYASSGLPGAPILRLRGFLVRQPAAVFTYATAAWLHGLDVAPCSPITYSLDTADAVEVQGFRATSLARTLFDLARRLPPVDAVPLIDVAVRRRLVSLEARRKDWLARTGARHVRRARTAMDLADPAAESQMESRLRVVLMLAGLPRPLLQVPIGDASGKVVGRADLYYPSHRLVIE